MIGAFASTPGVLIEDMTGLFGCNILVEKTRPFKAAGKVAMIHVLSPPEIIAPTVIGVNVDDDNGNERSDFEDEGPATSEDDLVEIHVRAVEPSGIQGTVTVTPNIKMMSCKLWKDRLDMSGPQWWG